MRKNSARQRTVGATLIGRVNFGPRVSIKRACSTMEGAQYFKLEDLKSVDFTITKGVFSKTVQYF